jgi:PAS domain S-box-containing protein
MTTVAPQSPVLPPDATELVSRIEARLPRDAESSALLGHLRQELAARSRSATESELDRAVPDIAERKRAEAALRESEQRFRALADNIPNLVWLATPEGDIQWCNQRWLDYTGVTAEQLRASELKVVHHPDYHEAVFSLWLRAVKDGVPWEDTFPLRGKDGSYRWFLSRAVPIRDESGRIVWWFGTNTDVTQLRETEIALEAANAQLQDRARELETVVSARTEELNEKIEALEAFSYSRSHDMRAPLRVMKGFSDILRTDYGPRLDPAGNRCIERIGSAASRLEQLIEDVLAYSRVVRAQTKLGPTDLERLIRQLIDENPALQPPHADIEIRSPLASVLAHPTALTQAIGNLLYNGVKFVAAGQHPHLAIWTEAGNDEVRLFIRDNGIGIPTQAQPRLFGMFQRFHAGQPYEGSGLGLAIARKAVERMGGTIGVESEPGRGSTFWIQLNPAPS